MRYFINRRPRGFHHKYIYTYEERKYLHDLHGDKIHWHGEQNQRGVHFFWTLIFPALAIILLLLGVLSII